MSTHRRHEAGRTMRSRLPADDAYWDDLADRVTAVASAELRAGAGTELVGANTRAAGDTPTREVAAAASVAPVTDGLAGAAAASAVGSRLDAARAGSQRATPATPSWLTLGEFAAPLAAAAMLALIAGYMLMPTVPATRANVGALAAASDGGTGVAAADSALVALVGVPVDAAPVALVQAALSPADPLARALLRDPAPPPVVGLLALRGEPADISTSEKPR